jgi:hypothetical protein
MVYSQWVACNVCAIDSTNKIHKIGIKLHTTENFRRDWSLCIRKLNIDRVDWMGRECDKDPFKVS